VLSISRSTTPSETPFSDYTLTRNIPQTSPLQTSKHLTQVFASHLSHKNHTTASHNVLLCQLRARLPGPLQPAEWPVRQLRHPESPTSPHTKLLLNILNQLYIGRKIFSHDLLICFTITPHGCQGSIIDIRGLSTAEGCF
jgi:hypothetical protein